MMYNEHLEYFKKVRNLCVDLHVWGECGMLKDICRLAYTRVDVCFLETILKQMIFV